ncbi:response regulator [Paenibacillaceae bacterium WGS1546]|uniref:response regulator transcription factor n=1 Tax=Cohnella sp. WGS1546 TaxID=3366810 RepID=UPI00372D0AB9
MIKVLIVDDEMIVRHAVKTLIRWDGSRFEYAGSAANGASALELVRETGADIVITDIKMPGMDGLELIKKLTEDGFGGEVLVLSNYNDFELVREALRCGAHDYMLKLTLKTESFMQTLEEMADKLDGKRGRERARTEKSMPDARGEDRNRISALLQEMDAPASGSAPWQGERFLEDGQRAFAFVVALRNDDRSVGRAGAFQEALDKLADGLFAGSRWVCAVRTDSRRFLLAAAYAAEAAAAADPQELARRLASLASMYYNVRIGVIYAPAALDEEALALEMRRNRQAEGLLFYAIPGPGCFSNRELADKDDETFGAAETALRDSMRKPIAGAIDLWTERALRLIDVAAERRVHPRALKRALSGGIWSIANAEGGREWDEKPWLEMVEAADSDSRLKETIRELSEEIAESAGASVRMSAAREEVRQAVRYLEEHYSDRVAIADVAARVGLSEPYLCQVFKADTGQSILTYLNEIRMLKAYELLASGRYLVKQAALEVGIPDPFYFNRLFRKRFGIAPKNVKTT